MPAGSCLKCKCSMARVVTSGFCGQYNTQAKVSCKTNIRDQYCYYQARKRLASINTPFVIGSLSHKYPQLVCPLLTGMCYGVTETKKCKTKSDRGDEINCGRKGLMISIVLKPTDSFHLVFITWLWSGKGMIDAQTPKINDG